MDRDDREISSNSSTTDFNLLILIEQEQELAEVSTDSPVPGEVIPNEVSPPDQLIRFGTAQHLMDNNPTHVGTNEAQDQERELDQPAEDYEHMPSPVNLNLDLDSPVPLSDDIQTAGTPVSTPYDDVMLEQRETVAETVESEDDDVEIIASESPAAESIENEVQNDPLNHTIENVLNATNSDVIDLTLTDDDEEETPLSPDVNSIPIIDLTQDDPEERTISTVTNQPVLNSSNEEGLSILPNSSSQPIDQKRSITGETENLSEQINMCIESPSRTKKRAHSHNNNLIDQQPLQNSESKRCRRWVSNP